MAKVKFAETSIKEETAKLKQAVELKKTAEEAHATILAITELIQAKTQMSFSSIVTQCLQSVFGPEYNFLFVIKRSRGKSVATPKFYKNGNHIPTKDAMGGGIIDVASFALRLTAIMLNRPKVRKLVVLDEPFKHVSKEYHSKIKIMLEELSKDLECQIIMTTHNEEMVAGKVITIA